jgi:electron transport complex protein RnfB
LYRILYAFLSVSGLGILFGLGLAMAARLLAIQKNELVEKLEEALPGLNCGTCGYAGCSAYAEAIAESTRSDEAAEVPLNLCLPGAAATAAKLADIMGVEVSFTAEKKVAQVHCRGGREIAKRQFAYVGVQDCNALYALYGGDKICPYGCLGKGSCIRVCPVDAIDYDETGLVVVDREKCISCGKCIDVCPTGVMKYIPYDADFLIGCNSADKGPAVKKYCSVGCIGCRICEKKTPEGGFVVENFLARIDYDSTGARGEQREAAAEACPTKCIIKTENLVRTKKV